MQSIKVVLVEDHELTRLAIRTLLQKYPHIKVLEEARDARSGLRAIETFQPNVAIVDIGLPDMSGIELTQRLKAAQSVNADSGTVADGTKVLIMTMQDDNEVVLAAFAAGADSYCMKDISPDRLVEALEVTAEGHAWIDPAIARVVLKQVRTENLVAVKTAPTVAINRLSDDENHLIAEYPLTDREREVLSLIVEGCSNAEISKRLYITVGTAKTHVRNILNKLCVSDRTQMAVRALRGGLVP